MDEDEAALAELAEQAGAELMRGHIAVGLPKHLIRGWLLESAAAAAQPGPPLCNTLVTVKVRRCNLPGG